MTDQTGMVAAGAVAEGGKPKKSASDILATARARLDLAVSALSESREDEIDDLKFYAGSPDNIIASFNRCDRGETFVDHHVFLCIEGPKTGLNHISFEVQNFDDVMLGHEHLKGANRYKHVWGIGRHVLGSQIFDYWQDPWGRVHEHWADTDMLNNSSKPNLLSAEEGLSSQWGDPAPAEFIAHATP